jgi:hypothetical protein
LACHASRRIRGCGAADSCADPGYHDKAFSKDRPVILCCASGPALSGKLFKDFGYGEVNNLGAFKDWAEGGGEVEK